MPDFRILALDPGTKRLGLALSDDMHWMARPLEVRKVSSKEEDLAYLRRTIEVHTVKEIVVGVPYRSDGTESRSTVMAKGWVASIRSAFPDMVVTERDETLTTWEAEDILKSRGLLPQDRRKMIDAFAAAVMLQEVLDERRTTSSSSL